MLAAHLPLQPKGEWRNLESDMQRASPESRRHPSDGPHARNHPHSRFPEAGAAASPMEEENRKIQNLQGGSFLVL